MAPDRRVPRVQSHDNAQGTNVTVDRQDWLARRFEEHRPRLYALARRMVASTGEADNAIELA
jgi:DNA-directed RNA polymerase specialized sigma24 family protein